MSHPAATFQPMDEATFRRILDEALDPKLASLRADLEGRIDGLDGRMAALEGRMAGLDGRIDALDGRIGALDGRIDALSEELRATEQRLIESGQLHFRQVSQLYKGLTERIESFEKHVIGQVAATRGAVEAVHGALQGQDYRTDELGRRVTALELREKE
jgi:uncharacterized coiled-coil protein SlyX